MANEANGARPVTRPSPRLQEAEEELMEMQEVLIARGPRPGALELQELTNAMVRIYKELFGRGPTKACCNYAGPDTLIATLEDSLTAAERNMIALGEHGRVRETRTFFQHTSERYFSETVERITGRKVRALVSGMDTHRDVSCEVFHLEPVAGAEARGG